METDGIAMQTDSAPFLDPALKAAGATDTHSARMP